MVTGHRHKDMLTRVAWPHTSKTQESTRTSRSTSLTKANNQLDDRIKSSPLSLEWELTANLSSAPSRDTRQTKHSCDLTSSPQGRWWCLWGGALGKNGEKVGEDRGIWGEGRKNTLQSEIPFWCWKYSAVVLSSAHKEHFPLFGLHLGKFRD